MFRLTPALVAATFLLAAAPLNAQKLTADIRAVVASPTQELAGTSLDPGLGAGVTLAYRLQPHLHIFGGWDWLHFNSGRSFAGTHADFEETGYSLGLRFEHPFSESLRILYRVEAAATYKHVEIEDYDGALLADSGHDTGFEAGAGVLLPVGEVWRLVPMLRYRSLPGSFNTPTFAANGDLRYVALEVAFSRPF